MSRKKKKPPRTRKQRAAKRISKRPATRRRVDADALFEQAVTHDRAGRSKKAIAAYRRVVKTAPAFARAHFNLGNLLARQGKMPDARAAFKNAVAADETFIDARVNLMNAQYQTGQYAHALESGEKALQLSAGSAAVYATLAGICRELGLPDRTIDFLQKALDRDPGNPALYNNLGDTLRRAGRLNRAALAFEKVVALDPGNMSARHLAAAMRGQKTAAAPRQYVVETFDKMSAGFDDHLVKDLFYATPALLKRALVQVGNPVGRFDNMIDLGCGTGLSGLAFKAMAKRLTGVDLSSKMIALADRRGIYTALENSGIEEFLEQSTDTFDLAVAADVFVYIGNLAPVYETLQNRLAPGAYFVFSTESGPTETWELLPTGRYAHSRPYIRSLAEKTGFNILWEEAARIRKEKQQWVMGDLYVLRKSAAL